MSRALTTVHIASYIPEMNAPRADIQLYGAFIFSVECGNTKRLITQRTGESP
jgi:hypothetical protein